MTRQRIAPWPTAEDVGTPHRMPVLLLLVTAPFRKLRPIEQQLEDDNRAFVAILLMVGYALVLVGLWVTALCVSLVMSWWAFAGFVALNSWVLWHVCAWLFEKKEH